MKALAVVLFSLLCISTYAENLKVGFIDTNQILNNLNQYKESLNTISKEFEPKKQELLDLYKHIELVRSKIELIKKSDSNESIQAELTKLLSLEKSFEQETEFWQNTINNRKIELLNKFELIINKTINEYALRENFDLILYDNVAFVSDQVNITQEIIAEIERP
ncbi:OmpH family outer membrane protein [Candidatus Thioglobus sp.]|nr:OmpH family outer membrane protein [Candidatus Thioglobus sp.]